MTSREASSSQSRNYLLTICYDGASYHGWQIQENAYTVQEAFQKAAKRIVGDNFSLKGCSRTDTGVHANMYCISLKCERDIPPHRLKSALNGNLPLDIAVLDCTLVPDDFHARYSCKGKEYVYKIWNSEVRNPFLEGHALHYRWKLDEKQLDRAAKHYLGTHDFSSFCTLDRREKGDFTRTVTQSCVRREGDMVLFTVSADGFLYNMVRIMTGTLLRVAQGKIKESDIPSIIDACDRSKAGPTAPACGLYLNRVFYDFEAINVTIQHPIPKT